MIRKLGITICIIVAILSLVAGYGTLQVTAQNRLLDGATALDSAKMIWYKVILPIKMPQDDDLWCLFCVTASCAIGFVVSCALLVITVRSPRR